MKTGSEYPEIHFSQPDTLYRISVGGYPCHDHDGVPGFCLELGFGAIHDRTGPSHGTIHEDGHGGIVVGTEAAGGLEFVHACGGGGETADESTAAGAYTSAEQGGGSERLAVGIASGHEQQQEADYKHWE